MAIKVAEQSKRPQRSRWQVRVAVFPLCLLADNDGDNAEAYVSSIQFSNGRRPDAFIQALGGPSAAKIPGSIKSNPGR